MSIKSKHFPWLTGALNHRSHIISSFSSLQGSNHSTPLFLEYTKLIPTSRSLHLLVLLSGILFFHNFSEKEPIFLFRCWLKCWISRRAFLEMTTLFQVPNSLSNVLFYFLHTVKLCYCFILLINSCLKKANSVTGRISHVLFVATTLSLGTKHRSAKKSKNTGVYLKKFIHIICNA